MKNFNVRSVFAVGASVLMLGLVGCTTTGSGSFSNTRILSDWKAAVAHDPMGEDENKRVTTISSNGHSSGHIVRLRGEEPLHQHDSDLTVTLLEGEGVLRYESRLIKAKKGDILFIPRGVTHSFVNTTDGLAVAYAVFTPGLSGAEVSVAPTVVLPGGDAPDPEPEPEEKAEDVASEDEDEGDDPEEKDEEKSESDAADEDDDEDAEEKDEDAEASSDDDEDEKDDSDADKDKTPSDSLDDLLNF